MFLCCLHIFYFSTMRWNKKIKKKYEKNGENNKYYLYRFFSWPIDLAQKLFAVNIASCWQLKYEINQEPGNNLHEIKVPQNKTYQIQISEISMAAVTWKVAVQKMEYLIIYFVWSNNPCLLIGFNRPSREVLTIYFWALLTRQSNPKTFFFWPFLGGIKIFSIFLF